MTLAGGIAAAIAFYDRHHITKQHIALLQVGWGLNLVLGASVVLAVCGLRMTLGRVETEDTITVLANNSGNAVRQGRSIAERLNELNDLHDGGLITPAEYETRRAAVLGDA